jgi:Bacterial aa3 type cytochrome c oxidase subunit IV
MAARRLMTAAQNCARNCGVPLLSRGNYAKSAANGPGFGEMGMADTLDHFDAEYATADGNDYAAHEQTYKNFITMVKVVMAIVVTIVVLMAIFLT